MNAKAIPGQKPTSTNQVRRVYFKKSKYFAGMPEIVDTIAAMHLVCLMSITHSNMVLKGAHSCHAVAGLVTALNIEWPGIVCTDYS